jgi:hypothetical protein
MRRCTATRRVLLALVAASAFAAPAFAADSDSPRNFTVHAGQRLTGDDNLFRLPDELDPTAMLDPSAYRSERISTSFVSLDGQWQQGRQDVIVDAYAAQNRFSRYAYLDNTSGHAQLGWRWSAGSRWSGRLGGRHGRTLGSFANTSTFAKDVIDTSAYDGDLRFALGSRWSTTVGGRRSQTLHGSEQRRGDDVDVAFSQVGLEYRTPAASVLSWTYAESDAEFATQALAGIESASDYRERTASFGIESALTNKIVANVRIGRLDRTYPSAPTADFAGSPWSAELRWAPTAKSRIALRRWNELRANLDAEAQHFESTGIGLTASWSPIATIEIAYQASSESQDYLTAQADPTGLSGRRDEPVAHSLRFAYAPRERFLLDFSYRSESRESNRARFDHSDEQLSLGVEVSF